MRGLINYWMRFWYAQNYAFCKSNEYVALQRGDAVEAAYWTSRADGWWLTWWRVGRTL